MNISPRCAEWLARISMAFVIYAILAVSFSCPLNSWAFVLCQISVYLLAGVPCILMECGGRGLTEMSLPSVFTLMSMQPRGENGILSKRHENRFHVADKNRDLRTVSVSWTPDGWFITAKPLDDIKPANAGAQMFSRNSALD